MTRRQRSALLRGIYVIVNEGERDPIALTREVVDAGVRVIQYRAKSGIIPQNLRALRELTRAAGALLLINDDWRVVQSFDCDGVHLGPGDSGHDDLRRVRAALEDRLIGISCGNQKEARAAQRYDADYIGVGAVFATTSKDDAGAPIGIEGLRAVAASTMLPIAAIGGVSHQNIIEVRRSGVAMAAVISAVANDREPRLAARRLIEMWESTR